MRADGRGWECTLSGAQGDGADEVQVHTGCVGEFGDEGFAAEVDAVEREVLTQFSNPHGTRVGGLASIDATIEVDGAEVRFTTSDAYANCSDSERCPAFVDRVTMSGRVSNEKLNTAFEWERALTTDEANRAARVEWSGTISRDGVDVGSMHKRALIEDRVALEVTLDGDAFTTQTVFGN